MQVFITGAVVNRQITAKIIVQIGSAIWYEGPPNFMIRDAITTPTLWRMSPRMWMKAARTLAFWEASIVDRFFLDFLVKLVFLASAWSWSWS
jgi:hypothetical protein